MSGVFDELVIQSAPNVTAASIGRTIGPIENGYADEDGVWIPAQDAEQVMASGFGIDPSGNPYFDTVAVDPGDEAALWLQASTGQIWLDNGDAGSGGGPAPLPSIVGEDTANVTQTTATLVGYINPLLNPGTAYQFEWGPTDNYGNTSPGVPGTVGSDDAVHAVTADITGLTAATLVHFRVNLSIGGLTVVNGPDQIFSTLPAGPTPVPTVDTGFVVGTPTSDTATVGAPVNPNGVPTTCILKYGLTAPAYGSVSPPTGNTDAGSGTSLEDVTFNLTGLAPSTPYHCQLVATNANGSTSTADFTFTTLPGGAPGPVDPPIIA